MLCYWGCSAAKGSFAKERGRQSVATVVRVITCFARHLLERRCQCCASATRCYHAQLYRYQGGSIVLAQLCIDHADSITCSLSFERSPERPGQATSGAQNIGSNLGLPLWRHLFEYAQQQNQIAVLTETQRQLEVRSS